MEYTIVKYLLAALCFILLVKDTRSDENGAKETESRQPRGLGTIVKMYSGNKPEPIHCDGEGFKADPANCAVFYRCVNAGKNKFTVYRFECGPGTVYDPETEVCNHPRSTKRSECREQVAPVDFEPQNENEIGESLNEVPSPISTKDPTFVVPSQFTTQKAIFISSTKNPFTTIPQKQATTTAALIKPSKAQTTNNRPNSVTRRPVKLDGDQCESDGFMGDSENCRKFYRCVNNGRGGFIRYEFSCSESTIWDDETQACNHPWAVQKRRCGRGGSEIEQHSNDKNSPAVGDQNEQPSTQEQLQISYGNKVTQSQTQISNGPVKQNQTQINYGDKANPKQPQHVKQNQTQISQGSAVSQTQTQINHGEKGFQTQLQIDHSKQNSQSQSQTYVDTTSKPQSSQQEKEQENNIKENKCSKSGFMADSTNCKKFYRCVDNGKGDYIKYEFSCGEGTVWDPKIEACNHAWAVNECGYNQESVPQNNVTSTTEQYHSTSYSTTSIVTVADISGDQQKPLTSPKPKPEMSSESTNDQDYDSGYNQQNTNETPEKSTTSTTRKPINENNDCKESGFVGDSEDCKKFYRCVDNGNGGFTRYEFSCGEGTVWDPEIEGCNHAWAVTKCGGAIGTSSQNTHSTTTEKDRSTTTHQPDTSPQSISSNDQESDSGYGQQSNDDPPIASSSSTPPQKENENNNCNKSGFMGDNADCKKFYRCVDNGNGGFTRYEFSCGEGTVWDPEIDACNHAWAVKKCGNQLESSDKTTSTSSSTTQSYHSSTISSISEPSSSQAPNVEPDYDSGYGNQNNIEPQTSTSQKPDGDNICKQNGFFGDNQDCKKFYRCVDNGNGGFTRYDFSCGEGTVWDHEIDACNHAWAVKKCGSSGTQQTETPSNSLNDESVSNQHTTQPESSTTSKPNKTESSTADNSQSSSTTKIPTDNDCSNEGFMGDKQDCKKFYRCVDDGKGGYTKYDFTCGDGTVWDQELQTCNHPSSESCKSENMEETDNASTTVPSSSTSKNDESTSETSSTTTVSKDKCKSEGFYANTEDCKKFYRCVDNGKGSFTKYDFTCGEGTVWVQEIQACDHDNDIKSCNYNSDNSATTQINEQAPSETNTQSTSTTEKNKEHPTSTTVITETPNKENDETNNSNSKPSSSEKCSSEGFYANKNDCMKFYRCVDNGNGGYTQYDFTCGEGTAWDQEIQACNHKNQVPTCEKSNDEIDNSNTADMPLNDPQGSQTTETTTTKKTTTSGSSETTSTEKDKCSQEGYFGNSEDCTKFYRCVDNGKGGYTKYDFDCGEGTIWDQDITTCNHPQDVSNPACESSDKAPSSSSSSEPSSAPSSESSSSSSDKPSSSTESNNQNSSNCSEETSSKKPQNVNCTKAGFYPDPEDCKKFYRCVDWDGDGQKFSVFHFDCGEGTIWDPELETCNYEDSVYPPRDCSTSQSQNEKPQESTTKKQDETTTQSSTTEQTSTEQSTTQRTTTQQSTTSEQTTTQQSTTNEPTTTQPASSEQTTTQQSTSSEQTTTQQTTTSEQTTTQQPTTSEQTTTQQPTTSDQTTTQQPTTSEQTTTQQPTTSVQTTTQQTTTNEQTTTQQPTTSEPTTTQQPTTSEQTTTQQPTTSEQTTTQQPTTSEQTTTQQPTTSEQTTTQQSTTNEQTTTEQSATQDPTTSENSTTEQPSNDTTTTESSTTNQQTTTEQMSSATTSSSNESSTSGTEQESTTDASSPAKDCPETEEDQYMYVCPTSFRRHPKYCNMFYQCTEDDESHDVKVAHFNCPNNTIYDESKTQCVEESKADKKCEGQIAQNRRVKRLNADTKEPIVVSKDKHTCPAVGHFPFEKFDQCSAAFFKCQKTKSGKLRGFVYRCPDDYVYWSVSRRCEPKSRIKDCKHSANSYNGRWEIPIERRNVAPLK